MYVDYGNDKVPVRVQTPWMKMPFDPDEQDNDRRSICLNCNNDTFRDKLKSLDDIIINVAKERSMKVFRKANVSDEFIDINYTRIIKNGGEYSDKFKMKATKDTTYFTDTKERTDGSKLSRGDEIRAIVELRYIWLNNGKFGDEVIEIYEGFQKITDEAPIILDRC
eukprot:SAG22_NODE_44_length_24912_cov_33.648894_12_plen_166_part_00